jgi:MoxR-like ATPase
MDVTEASSETERVLDEMSSAVIAEREFLETVLLGVVGRGHVLLEDVPGTGKTLTARSVADALGLSFSRIQFTPDLLPADITGTHVFNEPPKTQSALLEAMEEAQVTVDGDTYDLPQPFFVIATQNPVEMEGTFELPEAQVDRFLVKSSIGYPQESEEIELLRRRTQRQDQSPSVESVLSDERVAAVRQAPESVRVEEDLLSYMTAIARATREDRRVEVGVSPRGTQRLLEATRARAAMVGRDYVTPDDVKRVAQPVLAHRLVLTPDARVDEVQKAAVVDAVLDEIPVPTV